MELKLKLDYLKELIAEESRKSVGKIMKRFEIIENKEALKREVKELIHEQYRDLMGRIIAGGRGIEQTVFKFKSQDEIK